VFTETMARSFHTDPPVQMVKYHSTFLNVDNLPEDTNELDEINQRFQR
jgi:hypothetical protein